MAIFTAIASAIFGAGTFLAGLTAAGLEIASGIALNLIAKAISGANSTNATQFGVQGTLQAGGDIERSYVAGYGGTAGSLVYANEWGNVNQTPNAYNTQVICVSDLPVAGANAAGLAQIFVNGTLCSINWAATPTAQGYPVSQYNKNGVDHLWIKFYDGTQTVADSFLTSTFANASPVTSTITASIASPCVITWLAHGLPVNTPVVFTTTGALPTGITAGTTYYVISAGLGTDTFEISATVGGSAINTSGSQSGTHTGSRPGRPYKSTRVGTGCAYVIATALVNDGLFNGLPTYKFSIYGTKFYDISKDSTAGGSGTHRWATPSTWGGDGDSLPAVQIYNLLRGITFGGSWFYGLQNMPAARLPSQSWVDAINKCRATITGPNGAEPMYRSGGEVGINATIADTVTTFLTTCQGRLTEIGGTYKLHLGAPDSPVFSFDDGIILSTEEQTFTPFFGLSSTINGISAKYPSPNSGWSSTVAPPLYNSGYEVIDGNRRLMADVSLDFVPYAAQVQRLMLSSLQEARRARRHTFILPPEAWVLEPGDIVSYTSVRNGYSAKSFRIDGYSDQANLDVIVDITEVDPTDYNWTVGSNYQAPVDGALITARPSTQPVTGFSVSGYSVLDSTGAARRPTIQIVWTPQIDIQYVLWQVRLKASGVIVASGQISDVAAGSGILPSGPYLPNEIYQVHIKYQPFSQRDTYWSDEPAGTWNDVTTPNALLTAADVTGIVATLSQEYQNLLGLISGTAAGSIRSELDAINTKIAAQASSNLDDQLTNKVKTTALTVQTANGAAAVVAENSARVTGDAANAAAITNAIAALGTGVAAGLIEFDSSVTGSGSSAVAKIAIKVRANVGDTVTDSGIVIVASADGSGGTTSQILLKANLIAFTDGVHTGNAFTIDTVTGQVKFVGGRASKISSQDGTSAYFDFDNSDIYLQG